jgi:hypothetical protein
MRCLNFQIIKLAGMNNSLAKFAAESKERKSIRGISNSLRLLFGAALVLTQGFVDGIAGRSSFVEGRGLTQPVHEVERVGAA